MEWELHKLASSQMQLDWLREQIEMRVIGLSWIEFKTKWSSGKDEDVGTIDDLKGTGCAIDVCIVCDGIPYSLCCLIFCAQAI